MDTRLATTVVAATPGVRMLFQEETEPPPDVAVPPAETAALPVELLENEGAEDAALNPENEGSELPPMLPSMTADEATAAVVEALLAGRDVSAELEATAAGLTGTGAEEAGHGFLRLGRVSEGTTSTGYVFPTETVTLAPAEDQRLLIPDNPASISGLAPPPPGDASVGTDDGPMPLNENDLPGGSDPSPESTTATGSFFISASDGIASLAIDSHVIIENNVFTPVTFNTSSLGNELLVSITGYNPVTGEVSYSYTLVGNESHNAPPSDQNSEINPIFDTLPIVLVDGDGDTATGSLVIRIEDDVPTAIDDINGVASLNHTVVSGNVLTDGEDDVLGADGPAIAGAVTPATIIGTYGTLNLQANGAYSYTLNSSDPDFIALNTGGTATEIFQYTITDSDGDSDSATLTINIRNDDNGVTITNLTPAAQGGDAMVDEDDLDLPAAPGSAADPDDPVTVNGDFSIAVPDGVNSIDIGGTLISLAALTNSSSVPISITTSLGNTLTITGYSGDAAGGTVSYSYTLLASETHDNGLGESSLFDSLAVTVTDTDGDTASDTLTIAVVDDLPTAVDDGSSLVEDSAVPVTGSVLGNDLHANGQPGADTPTSLVSWNSTTASYGTFTDTGNGTWSYTLDNTNPLVQALDNGESLTETFTYTMQDADGDTDSASLTVTIHGTNDIPVITADPGNGSEGGNDSVFEAGLAAGSNAAAASEFATGTFTVSDTDGLDDIDSVTINGTTVAIASLVGSSFAGAHGTLTVDSYAAGVASYTYELTAPTTDAVGTETDVFTFTVSDGTSDSAPAAITIEIVDDLPTAVDDGSSLVEDSAVPVTGSVLGNDLHANGQPGADAPTSLVSWASTTASYGTFTDTGSGTWSYTLDNANPLVQALDNGESLTETLTYTMQDADGDTDSASLTVTIHGTNDIPVITADPGNGSEGGNDSVSETGLAIGSNAAALSEFATGTFTVSDTDGLDDIDSVTINGTTVAIASLVGSSFAGAHGTLTVDSYAAGVASYTYELTAPTTDAVGTETDVFTFTVSDGTSDSAPAAITIEIVDDLPTVGVQAGIAVDEDGLGGNDGGIGDIAGNITTVNGNLVFVAGADGIGSLSFASLDGGTASFTSGGENVTYSWDAGSNTLTARADNSLVVVFTLMITSLSTGAYTFTLEGPVDHANPDEDNVLVNLPFTLTDGDGDFASGSLNVAINDDTPVIGLIQNGTMGNAAGVLIGEVDVSFGGDGGSFNLAGTPPAGITYTTVNAPDGSSVLTATVDGTGDTFFILSMSADGQYSFELITPNPTTTVTNTLIGLTPGGPVPVLVLDIGGSGLMATFTGTGDKGINSSANGMGVDNNLVNGGETMFISFDDATTGVGRDNVFNTSFAINKISSGDVLTWSAWDDGVMVASGTWTPPAGTGEGDDVSWNLLDNPFTIFTTGSAAGIVSSGFDEFRLGALVGDDYRLLSMSVEKDLYPGDNTIAFALGVTDGDGDSVPGTLVIGIEGDSSEASGFVLTGSSGSDVLLGGRGPDTLDGAGGDDRLTGAGGNDSLAGGTGADVFTWQLHDNGSAGIPATDIVTDFNIAAGDVLDLKDLLVGETGSTLTDYLHFALNGTNTVVSISSSGAFDGSNYATASDQSIVLSNVDLVTGSINDSDIINSLIAGSNLRTDA